MDESKATIAISNIAHLAKFRAQKHTNGMECVGYSFVCYARTPDILVLRCERLVGIIEIAGNCARTLYLFPDANISQWNDTLLCHPEIERREIRSKIQQRSGTNKSVFMEAVISNIFAS